MNLGVPRPLIMVHFLKTITSGYVPVTFGHGFRGLFDNIDHEMLMDAVKMHAREKWVLLYTERFLGSVKPSV